MQSCIMVHSSLCLQCGLHIPSPSYTGSKAGGQHRGSFPLEWCYKGFYNIQSKGIYHHMWYFSTYLLGSDMIFCMSDSSLTALKTRAPSHMCCSCHPKSSLYIPVDVKQIVSSSHIVSGFCDSAQMPVASDCGTLQVCGLGHLNR